MNLYGPYAVFDHDADGMLSDTLAAGVHYTTDTGYFAANEAALGQYRATPTHPLQNVLAGDDPANPAFTVPIVFPDEATADAVIAQLI